MADLITQTRLKIKDSAGASQQFTDLQVQDELDRNRSDIRYMELKPAETLSLTGDVTWLDYYSDCEDWEADAVLKGYDGTNPYATLTTLTADYLTGHWTFAADVKPPVYIMGKTYDLNAAAASLLELWAAAVKLHFDVSEQGVSMSRHQKYETLIAMAKEYRSKGKPRHIQMKRKDVNYTSSGRRGRNSWSTNF